MKLFIYYYLFIYTQIPAEVRGQNMGRNEWESEAGSWNQTTGLLLKALLYL